MNDIIWEKIVLPTFMYHLSMAREVIHELGKGIQIEKPFFQAFVIIFNILQDFCIF